MNFRGKFTELLLCFAIFLAMSVNTATALAESCAVDFGLRFLRYDGTPYVKVPVQITVDGVEYTYKTNNQGIVVALNIPRDGGLINQAVKVNGVSLSMSRYCCVAYSPCSSLGDKGDGIRRECLISTLKELPEGEFPPGIGYDDWGCKAQLCVYSAINTACWSQNDVQAYLLRDKTPLKESGEVQFAGPMSYMKSVPITEEPPESEGNASTTKVWIKPQQGKTWRFTEMNVAAAVPVKFLSCDRSGNLRFRGRSTYRKTKDISYGMEVEMTLQNSGGSLVSPSYDKMDVKLGYRSQQIGSLPITHYYAGKLSIQSSDEVSIQDVMRLCKRVKSKR